MKPRGPGATRRWVGVGPVVAVLGLGSVAAVQHTGLPKPQPHVDALGGLASDRTEIGEVDRPGLRSTLEAVIATAQPALLVEGYAAYRIVGSRARSATHHAEVPADWLRGITEGLAGQ